MSRAQMWGAVFVGVAFLSIPQTQAPAADKPAVKAQKTEGEATTGPATVQAPAKLKKVKVAALERAIERALDRPVELDFVAARFKDVVAALGTRYAVEMQLDEKALSEASFDPDKEVDFKAKGLPLRAALDLLLRPYDLAWTIHNGIVLITTKEELSKPEMLITRTYDVADLVVCRDIKDRLWDDYQTLIEMVTSAVRPDEWDDKGGNGAIKGASLGTAKILVVSTTCSGHRQIAQLLADIRAVAAKHPDAGLPRRDSAQKPQPAYERSTLPPVVGASGKAAVPPTPAAPAKQPEVAKAIHPHDDIGPPDDSIGLPRRD